MRVGRRWTVLGAALAVMVSLGLPAQAAAEPLRRPSIVGGVAVTWPVPWAVRILVDGRAYCSGSLIAPTWVLTARHCVDETSVRSLDLRIGAADSARGERRAAVVGGIRMHPELDAALIRLYTPVGGGTMPLAGGVRVGQRVSGYGYGWNEGATPQRRLKSASLRVVYTNGDLFSARGITGYTQPGDSGGPILLDGRQVGVSRSGSSEPGAGSSNPQLDVSQHVRISAIRSWIRSTAGV